MKYGPGFMLHAVVFKLIIFANLQCKKVHPMIGCYNWLLQCMFPTNSTYIYIYMYISEYLYHIVTIWLSVVALHWWLSIVFQPQMAKTWKVYFATMYVSNKFNIHFCEYLCNVITNCLAICCCFALTAFHSLPTSVGKNLKGLFWMKLVPWLVPQLLFATESYIYID